ncbi:N-acetyltransferase family protein [Clostridium sp.]|uniref:GNAT family N-acetyltransferase n=1 Tax=Clostridium sp. TaxID=1506 RepID=UPI003D6D7F94
MKCLMLKNGDTLLIREAKGSDAKKVLEYVNTISSESDFLTFGQGEFIMSIEQEEKYLDNSLKQISAIYIIAEINDKIVGSLNFSAGKRPRIEHTGEFGVSVLEEYWENGIGTELIKYLIEWSKQLGLIMLQ